MIKINTKSLEYILKVTPAEQNIMLVGRHGIGKSKIIENYFKRNGFKVVNLFLGQMSDPGDLIGLPQKNEKLGQTEFLLPYWFPTDNQPIVLFLDELNRARPEVLQTIMDLTLNRKLAGKSLPEGSRIISAVNNGEQYSLTELDPALVSRFNVYEFVPSVEEWLHWAEYVGIDRRIISFIQENPNMLDGTEYDKSIMGLERTPDRRSWERLSDVMQNMSEIGKLELDVFSGIIGVAAASQFYSSISEHRIISAVEILNSKNFNSIKTQLENYKISELAVINESIFCFLDVENYDSSSENQILSNLENYFELINKMESKEPIAHFVNLFAGANYPHAVTTIVTKCEKIYNAIQEFILKIGQN